MQVITLAKAKTLLGISDSSQDAAITSAIPYIDSAVKQITRNRWNLRVVGTTESSSTSVRLTSAISPKYYLPAGHVTPYDDLDEFIQTGQLISGTGIPADTYISEVFYNYPEGVIVDDDFTLEVTLSQAATATGTSVAIYLGIPISYQPVIAKGIQWHINQLNTTITDNSWKSRRIGPVSVSKGDGEKIDGKSGMPLWFVRSFPRYHGGH